MRYQLLVVVLAISFLQCQNKNRKAQIATLTLKGSESMHKTFDALKEDFELTQDSIIIQIEGGGSRTGLMAINNEEVDIGMSSYNFNLEQELGLEHDITEQVVAYDGIVLINNELNRIKNLTDDQISKIFRGEISDWSELGGLPGKILPISRDENSGTQKFFSSYFKINQLSASSLVAENNDEIVHEIMTNQNGIGYVGFGYFKTGVNDISIPPTKSDIDTFYHPTVKNLSLGLYPLKRGLRIYYRDNGDETLNSFLFYLGSERAQKIIEDHGLVSKNQEVYYNASADY